MLLSCSKNKEVVIQPIIKIQESKIEKSHTSILIGDSYVQTLSKTTELDKLKISVSHLHKNLKVQDLIHLLKKSKVDSSITRVFISCVISEDVSLILKSQISKTFPNCQTIYLIKSPEISRKNKSSYSQEQTDFYPNYRENGFKLIDCGAIKFKTNHSSKRPGNLWAISVIDSIKRINDDKVD